MAERKKPSVQSDSQKELDKIEKQFDAFDQQVKDLTLDRLNEAPKQEMEPQTKISQADIAKSNEIYLKPKRSISAKEKFNENYREKYNYAKEYVNFIAEHKEIPGETIQSIWTKPFAGIPAQEWDVPVNKPVWGPRYLAEQISRAKYHRLKMEQTTTGVDQNGQYYGTLVVDNVVQRLDAMPVSSKRSIFMGAKSF